MEALEIESQTDQAAFESVGQFPARGELAEAQHLLDDADHRFNGAFACPVDRFAQHGLELVGHLEPSNSRPGVVDRAGARTVAASLDDGDHAPSRYTARYRASHTPAGWRGQNTRHPVPPPLSCQSPRDEQQGECRAPDSRWDDLREPMLR